MEGAREQAAPTPNELIQLRAKVMASLVKQPPDPLLLPFSVGRLASVALVAAVGLGAWTLRGALLEHPHPSAAAVAAVHPPPPAVMPAEPKVGCPPAPTCAPAPVRGVACAPAGREIGSGLRPREANADETPAAMRPRGREESLFSAEAAKRDPSLELELLVLARVAIDEERAMDALGHALRHEQLYPKSGFEEERLAIQVMANCMEGNRDDAAAGLERLLQLAPHSTYLPRIRGTCDRGVEDPP
jgi:hypothetical protein